jgi:hypothetical protein
MKLRSALRLLLAAGACACSLAASLAHADIREMFGYTDSTTPVMLQLNGGAAQVRAADQGWFDDMGDRGNATGNYATGVCGIVYLCANPRDTVYRNFFVFNLAGIAPQIASASLVLWNPDKFDVSGPGYFSTHDSETFVLHEVHSAPSDLAMIDSHRLDLFQDLADGPFYGDRVVSWSDNGTFVSVSLNAAGIAALNEAAGGAIVIGGSLVGVDPIPEPDALPLMLVGISLLAWQVRRRREVL